MLKWLLNISGIEELLGEIFTYAWKRASEWITKSCEKLINLSSTAADKFWDYDLILGFLRFSRWVAVGVVAASTVMLIFDVVEDAGRQRKIDFTVVYTNFFKGLAFALIAPEAGKYALMVINQLAGSLKISGILQTNLVNNINKTGNPVVTWILVAIASVVFLVMSLARFGTMFVQCMTPCLYVSDIVRGETAAMGSWIRQTTAIAITHLIQTSLFYLGAYFTGIDFTLFLAGACWIGMIQTKKVLDKYGMSCGVTGVVSSAAQAAVQGITLVSKVL